MRKKQHLFKSIFLFAALLTAVIACKKDSSQPTTDPIIAALFAKNDTLHVPAAIAVPTTDSFSFALVGKGYQYYTVRMQGPGDPLIRISTGVKADLYNKNNQKIGTHFSGPNWQVGTDTIKGINEKEAKLTDVNNIDWLRFNASNGGKNSLMGMFKNVTYVQQVLTIGGQPSGLRNPGVGDVNKTDSVSYIAVYRFNVAKKI